MIHVHQSKDGQLYATLKARNGLVLSTTETVKTKASMRKNIRAQIKAFGGKSVRVRWPDGAIEKIDLQ